MTPSLILPFADVAPRFAGEPVFAGPRSAVLGRATIGTGVHLGADCVVRADGEAVRMGDNVWLGARATVHIVHELTPAIIGRDVTIGANAIVHACTIGDGCVLEQDVIVLDDATVEAGVLIEANSTVFPRKRLEAGLVYAGSPAKPVRALHPGELAARAARVRGGDEAPNEAPGDLRGFSGHPAGRHPADARASDDTAFINEATSMEEALFMAVTARRAGRVTFAPGSSLFFSCLIEAGTGTIAVGPNTNVQDNSLLSAGTGTIVIGADTTIGHNVRMTGSVRVGDRALIGIGAVLGDGAVVQDDVLLAAGSTTEPGQVIESGWMWGGRPAKPISRLDEGRRAGMARNILNYCEYAQLFRRVQDEAGRTKRAG